MDLYRAIDELRAEMRRLDQIIAHLESLEDREPAKTPRGKKNSRAGRGGRAVRGAKAVAASAAANPQAVPGLEISESMVRFWNQEQQPEQDQDGTAQQQKTPSATGES